MFICFYPGTCDFAFGDSLNQAFQNLLEIVDDDIAGHEVRFFREVEVEMDVKYTFAEISE